MTDSATPAASPDTSAPASAPDAAATPAAPAVDRSPAARRARAEAFIEAPAPAPEPSARAAEPEQPAATPSAEPKAPAVDEREARIAAKLQEQRAARETKQREENQRRYEAETRELQRKAMERNAQPTAAEVVAELKRDPAGARRKYGIDPRADLDALTQELLNPGHHAQSNGIEEARAEARAAAARAEAIEQRLAQRDADAELSNRRHHFVTTTADEARWPLLSKLDPEDRLDEGVTSWQVLASQGADYDPEMIADAAEARLSRRAKKWQPAAAPKTTEPAALAKPKARTITPALASDSGTPPNLTREQKKARLVADLERANAAKRAARTSP